MRLLCLRLLVFQLYWLSCSLALSRARMALGLASKQPPKQLRALHRNVTFAAVAALPKTTT